jgi:hypothetical protein
MDEGIAALKGCNLAIVIVDTNDVMTHFSEADGSDQADIPRPNNGDLNVFTHSLDGGLPQQ